MSSRTAPYVHCALEFLLSAALQCTPISEPAFFCNDVHRGKDAPSQLSLLNNTLQHKDALLNDNRVAPLLPPITVRPDESAVRLAPEASHTVPYG